MAGTGNQSTIVMADSGFTANMHMIGATEQEGEAIEDSHLATVEKKTFFPGDLYDAGEFEAEFEWNDSEMPPIHQIEAITITYPVPEGLSNGGTLSGTGFIIKRSTPELKNNQIRTGKYTVKWDGKTGPEYNAPS